MFYRDLILNEVKAKYFKTTAEQDDTKRLQKRLEDKDTKEKNKIRAEYLRKRGFNKMTEPVDNYSRMNDKNYEKRMTNLKNSGAKDLKLSSKYGNKF